MKITKTKEELIEAIKSLFPVTKLISNSGYHAVRVEIEGRRKITVSIGSSCKVVIFTTDRTVVVKQTNLTIEDCRFLSLITGEVPKIIELSLKTENF